MAVYQAVQANFASNFYGFLLCLPRELSFSCTVHIIKRSGVKSGDIEVTVKLHSTVRGASNLLVVAFACLLPALCVAANTISPGAKSDQDQPLVIFPLQQQQVPNGLSFSPGTSNSRTLELQLAQPLSLNINSALNQLPNGFRSVLLDTSADLQLNDYVDITTGMGSSRSQSSFQALGSIHCQNGILEQGSFRASECYFMDQADALKQDQISLGLKYSNGNLSSGLSMFKVDTSMRQQFTNNRTTPFSNPVLEAGLITPAQNNPLAPAFALGQMPAYMQGEASGLEMEFQLGLTTDNAGDVVLGLHLTRVLDASFKTSTLNSAGLQNWTVSSPYDSARLGVDWNKGNFSGGVNGFYRNEVEFLNRSNLDSITTFDVHFTWRTPWNANLSVGTTNVLNSGAEDKNKTDSGLQDPFESVYGRIPYVRYQQDL